MYYKTILVHVDSTDTSPARTRFAAELAKVQDAHLVGVTQTGIMRFVYQATMPEVDLSGLTPLFDELARNAEERARNFDAMAQQAGLASYEHRIGDDDPGYALAAQAVYADLAIVGQSGPHGRDKPDGPSIPEYVAMNCPCPVLVLPYAGSYRPVFERILIAWNASPEAARAVRMALPFLTQAKQVTVAIVEHHPDRPSRAAGSGGDIALFLARHGVAVDVQQRYSDDAAQCLLSLANEQAADLLVMGCYGHSRFREIVLGGVSRAMLHCMTIPVLLAH